MDFFYLLKFLTPYSSLEKTSIYHPPLANTLIKIVQVFYNIFNMDFFGIDAISFCLWKKASTLHTLAFKFTTVVVASLYVLLTICCLNRFLRLHKILLYLKGSSITHGLSIFLALVYMQCTKVCPFVF